MARNKFFLSGTASKFFPIPCTRVRHITCARRICVSRALSKIIINERRKGIQRAFSDMAIVRFLLKRFAHELSVCIKELGKLFNLIWRYAKDLFSIFIRRNKSIKIKFSVTNFD